MTQQPSDSLVVVDNLVKRYQKSPRNAVDGISFIAGQGEILGLLGPNGAGKTTTVGMLTTRIRPTAGRATVAGHDVVRDPVGAKRALAVVPQLNNLDRSLTARQNLLFHAAYFGMPADERSERADTLLEEFGLADQRDSKVDWYSGGMVQRLMIARALMHDPQVIFLDEPTSGLDPQARLFVWDRIEVLRDRGMTILLTTHDMNEAGRLADKVAIMDYGKFLVLDTREALTAMVPGTSTLDLHVASAKNLGTEQIVTLLTKLDGVERVEPVEDVPESDSTRHIRLYAAVDAVLMVAPAVQMLNSHDIALADMRLGEATLEDVFIYLTGRALR